MEWKQLLIETSLSVSNSKQRGTEGALTAVRLLVLLLLGFQRLFIKALLAFLGAFVEGLVAEREVGVLSRFGGL
jgi:hypothetical protein